MKQNDVARRNQAEQETAGQAVGYTPGPWEVIEQSPHGWTVVEQSSMRAIATIPGTMSDREQQANARLIALSASMHSAAVKLLCVWGTEDAPEAMEELAVILSQAARG